MEKNCWNCTFFWGCKNLSKYKRKDVCEKYANGKATINWVIVPKRKQATAWWLEKNEGENL